MVLLLPLSCFLIFNIINSNKNKFLSFLISVCLTFAYLYTATEVLSLFNGISELSIKCCWSAFVVILGILNIIKFIKNKEILNKKINLNDILKKIQFTHIIIAFFVVLIIFIGINTTPYNWDSMTYHLPRIMHWIQNGNINHYATNIIRQLTSPAFAEVANLNVYLLSDSSDIYANLLQTVSFILNAFIVYFIAKKIGCDKKFSYLAMILAFSMPIALAEAFSTQVDNFACLWCLIFTYIILDYLNINEKVKINKENILKLICLGICLGLGYLTKPTILFSNALFTLYLGYMCIRRKDNIKNLLISCFIVGVTTLIIIMPTTIRNLKTFNAISDPIAGEKQIVHVDRKSYFAVNFVKNLLWNYQIPLIGDNNEIIKNGIEEFSEALNVNINDESISEAGLEFHIREDAYYHHDYAVNPIVMWLITIATIIYIIGFRNNKEKKSIMYCVISIMSFIIFILIMRFQVWETRYEISFLTLLCPAISLLLNLGLKDKYQKYLIGAIGCIVLISMINQFGYHIRYIQKLEDKNEEYFRSNKIEYYNYLKISEVINDYDYKNIGLEITEDTYEYPLFKMLKKAEKIEHINVQNSSMTYYNQDYLPEFVISNVSKENSKIYNQKSYEKIKEINGFNIYKLVNK